MNTKNLVSVIVPVYNVEQYIKKCLDSIINQTYTNLEIILVDDGSTDQSGEICDEYAAKDDRITVIHKENEGHNSARKMGMKLSHGNYIYFIDSDDWIEPEMLDEMLENLISSNSDFVHTGTILETNGKSIYDCRYENRIVDFPQNDLTIWREIMNVDTNNYINRTLTRKMFKRELITKCYSHTPNDLKYGEDFVTVARCLMECSRVSFFKKAFYHYNIREGSITRTSGVERIYMAVYQYEELRKLFIEYNMYNYIKEMLEKACTKETFNLIKNSEHIRGFIPSWIFDDIDSLRGKNVIIYGAGKVGYNYYVQLSRYYDINIIAWVDKSPEKYCYPERKIDSKDIVFNSKYDVILIAVNDQQLSENIIEKFVKSGIDRSKIIWKKPQRII